MSVGAKIWHLLPHDSHAIDSLAQSLRVSPIVAQLLLNRQISEPQAAKRFLASTLSGLHEPELLPGMADAVERLLAAVGDQRRICVYGDYDIDGVTGTAILLTCLTLLGGNVEFHVPNRLEHGYGLNSATLRTLAEHGVKLVVTVDCGIASAAEAEEARRLGLELIITDHHEPRGGLPGADVLIHPRIANGTNGAAPYPFGGLCGARVAFKLAWALCKKHCGGAKVTEPLREFLLDAVALAAMGTVADVVPLFEENRILVKHGLARLKEKPTLGLGALLRIAKLDGKVKLLAGDVGYSLAPRINAAGRLGGADCAVELLMTRSSERATELAEHLENQNQERQQLERRILFEARTLAGQFSHLPALVLADAEWHPGLIGIVASRLVDEYARPVLMIALRKDQPHGQIGRASCRERVSTLV
jgi:single-stranded-DNA-specific exonuclease